MPRTGKKNVTHQTKPRKVQKRPQKKKTPRPKRAKKGLPPDIWQAMLLTVSLIAIAAIISMVVIRTGSTTALDTVLPLEILPPVETLPSVEVSSPMEMVSVTETVPPLRVTGPETTIVETAVLTSLTPQETLVPQVVPTPQGRPTPQVTSISKLTSIPQETPVLLTMQPEQKNRGTLVFVIDDAGNNLLELEPFLRFPGPLTIAVLPGLPHSVEAARRVRAAGKDLFLHQPMEALGGQPPGPGAIYADMDAAEILAVLKQNIAEIGPITGMNNHQGSKITEDQQIMETVLAFCREQGIQFLDSRTTTQTAVPAAAKKLGIKIGERNIFIDNDPDRLSMNRSIQDGLTLAVQKGKAVMIGHVQSPELAPLLMELYQDLIDQGYTFATASSLIIQHTTTN
jgi:polysaccharide deacetylase 2 family uncharacterized protein YibQ